MAPPRHTINTLTRKHKMTHKVRSAYGHKHNEGFTFDQPSLTKQSFTEECNINNIMKKYQKTGAIDHLNKHEASYGYASSDDFTKSMETVARGTNMFQELPSSIRNKFENDPAKFLEFVQNEENLVEMQELGLATKNPTQIIIEEETTPPAKPSDAVAAKPETDAVSETP